MKKKPLFKDILLFVCYLVVGFIIFTLGGAIRSARHAPHTPRFVSQAKESNYSVKKSILRVEDLPSRNPKNTISVSHKDPALSIVLWGIGAILAFLVIVVVLLDFKSIVSSLKHKISIVKNRTRAQAKKYLLKEKINLQDALSLLNESPHLETNAISSKEVEGEILSEFPLLKDYLDTVFPWLSQEVSNKQAIILSASQHNKVPPQAVIYALLSAQISEQLNLKKPIADVTEMKRLHFYLLEKLSAWNYFPQEVSVRKQ